MSTDAELTSAKISMELLSQAEEFDGLVVLYHRKDGSRGYYVSTGTGDVLAIGLAEWFKHDFMEDDE